MGEMNSKDQRINRVESAPADGAGRPMVSVIVPALNAAASIGACLQALINQTYDRERYEIIVVDNGSRDETSELADRYPVLLLQEGRWRSPYAARNTGIARAGGEVLAFTDADCTPEQTWLERGVEVLESAGADLIGGKVTFTFSRPARLGELADALWHLDVKRQIETNRACMTANLLVWRKVVDVIGPFDPRVRSGGDGRWTRRATDAGFTLVYAPLAEVRKPSRPMRPLLRKGYRIGRGLPAAWMERSCGRGGVPAGIVRLLVPPSPSMVKQRIQDRGYDEMAGRFAGLWSVTWLLHVVRAVGCSRGWIDIVRERAGESTVGHDVRR
jgi:glycosyltransferase AglE